MAAPTPLTATSVSEREFVRFFDPILPRDPIQLVAAICALQAAGSTQVTTAAASAVRLAHPCYDAVCTASECVGGSSNHLAEAAEGWLQR